MKRFLFAIGILCLVGTGAQSFWQSRLQIAAPSGQQFFVASTGNNANPGTQASPWLDLTNVNSHTFGTNDCVNLNGGDTFGGGTTGISSTTLRCVTSYGTGQATISTGNSAAGWTATNIPGLTVSNVVFTGGGATTNTKFGILLLNSGLTQLAGPTFDNVTVSGYGEACVAVHGTSGQKGFTGSSLTNSNIHDCTSKSAAGVGSACVQFVGMDEVQHLNTNITITGNTVSSCNGTAGLAPGSCIWVESFDTLYAALNTAHDCGVNNTTASGPEGIIVSIGNNCTIEKNQVYNIHSSSGTDGGGIDIDFAMTNCIAQKNWVHDTDGPLIELYNANNGLGQTVVWSGNHIRSNILQRGGAGCFGVGFPSSTMQASFIYDNTCYQDANNAYVVGNILSGGTSQLTFANNIFDINVQSGGKFTNTTANPSWTFTGNDYFGTFTTYTWNSTNYSTFAAWQTATGFEKIAGVNVGQTVEPRLVVYGAGPTTTSPYDTTAMNVYQLQNGSPMLTGGVDIAAQYSISIGDDYFGVPMVAKVIGAGQEIPWSGASSASSAEATALINRMTTPTLGQQQRANAIVSGFKFDSELAKTAAFWMLAADTQANALLNFSSTSFTLTPTNSPTFTAGAGFTGTGGSDYVNTNLTPSTAGSVCTQNSCSLLVYGTTNSTTADDTWQIGADDGTASSGIANMVDFAGPPNTCNTVNENDAQCNLVANPNAMGLYIQSRTGASASQAYKNAAAFGVAYTATSNGLPTLPIVLLSLNEGPPDPSTTQTISFAGVFSGLALADAFKISQRVNAAAWALGINKYN